MWLCFGTWSPLPLVPHCVVSQRKHWPRNATCLRLKWARFISWHREQLVLSERTQNHRVTRMTALGSGYLSGSVSFAMLHASTSEITSRATATGGDFLTSHFRTPSTLNNRKGLIPWPTTANRIRIAIVFEIFESQLPTSRTFNQTASARTDCPQPHQCPSVDFTESNVLGTSTASISRCSMQTLTDTPGTRVSWTRWSRREVMQSCRWPSCCNWLAELMFC